MRLPSLKNLQRLTDAKTAKALRALLEGKTDPCEVSERCARWVASCYHVPPREEQIMRAACEMLGMHDVEGSCDDDGRNGVSYCNAGDSYALTLTLKGGTFRVQSYVDLHGGDF